MIPDPTAEIKEIRHQLGADADFDLDRTFNDLQRRQATSGRYYIRLPGREPADRRGMQASGDKVGCQRSRPPVLST